MRGGNTASNLLFGTRKSKPIGDFVALQTRADYGIGKSIYLDENVGSWFESNSRKQYYYAFAKGDLVSIHRRAMIEDLCKRYKFKDPEGFENIMKGKEFPVEIKQLYPKVALYKKRGVVVVSSADHIDVVYQYPLEVTEWLVQQGYTHHTQATISAAPSALGAELIPGFNGAISPIEPRSFPKELVQGTEMFDVTMTGREFVLRGEQLETIVKLMFVGHKLDSMSITLAPGQLRCLEISGRRLLVADGSKGKILVQARLTNGIFQGYIEKPVLNAIGIHAVTSWDREIICPERFHKWP